MADEEFGFGDDVSGSSSRGKKRSYGDISDNEDGSPGSSEGNPRVEETKPGGHAVTVLSLGESIRCCENGIATCKAEIGTLNSELQKWRSILPNDAATLTDPTSAFDYFRTLKSSQESMKEELKKLNRRNAVLAEKYRKQEWELTALKSEVRTLKTEVKPQPMQQGRLHLDPAMHAQFTRLQKLLEEKDVEIRELEATIEDTNFSLQSKQGMMLTAKCNTLHAENEEAGTFLSEGKVHELKMRLALQKSQYLKMRNHLEGMCKKAEAMSKEVEQNNEKVLSLQQNLEEKVSELERLREGLHHMNLMKEINDDTSNDKMVNEQVNRRHAKVSQHVNSGTEKDSEEVKLTDEKASEEVNFVIEKMADEVALSIKKVGEVNSEDKKVVSENSDEEMKNEVNLDKKVSNEGNSGEEKTIDDANWEEKEVSGNGKLGDEVVSKDLKSGNEEVNVKEDGEVGGDTNLDDEKVNVSSEEEDGEIGGNVNLGDEEVNVADDSFEEREEGEISADVDTNSRDNEASDDAKSVEKNVINVVNSEDEEVNIVD